MLRLGLAGATVAAIPHAAQSLQRGHAPRILVFDVNETLLDLRALEPHFERAFGDKTMLREWFHHVIEYAEALTLTGDYRAFGDVARAALQMTAKSQGVALSANDEQQIVGGFAICRLTRKCRKALIVSKAQVCGWLPLPTLLQRL